MLEAGAAGTPVVASSAAVPAILGPYAQRFAPGDARALAARLTALARDPAAARARAAAGALVLRAFTWDHFASGTAAVYREFAHG
jgi:glycosyltransferase involved in cell wall biosynthesis